ncbi:MAG: hypothetical protein ACI4KA_08155 [Oscillospiraceae bacterium]
MKNAVSQPKNSRMFLYCAFAVYAVLTLIGALNHELWFDEAQAWTIARDNDITGIISMMKQEGHPALWHFILHLLSRIGMTAEYLPLLSWAITCVTAALVLLRAPFATALKCLVVFSGGFLFYWSVTARSYCIAALVMVLIAINYKRRNERPILFGVLVALLANTHVMMCGMVGILGLYMIADLIKLWRTSSVRENLARLVGLAVSGLGVIALVLPLIGSLSANNLTQEKTTELTIPEVLQSAFYSFASTSYSLLFDSQSNSISNSLLYFVAMLFGIALLMVIFFMRHYRKECIMLAVSTGMYAVVCEVIWHSFPSRAMIFLLMFFVTYWIARENTAPLPSKPLSEEKSDSALSRRLAGSYNRLEKSFDKTICALLCVCYAAAVPMGAYLLFADYALDYSQSRKTAEFIKNELPEDAVLVVSEDTVSAYSAYLPGDRFYCLGTADYVTYCMHRDFDGEPDYAQIYDDLKDCASLYRMEFLLRPSSGESKVVYSSEGSLNGLSIPWDSYVVITEFDLEKEILPLI